MFREKFIPLIRIIVCTLFFFGISNEFRAQDVSCTELMDFVKSNGYKKGSLNSLSLNSSWLHEVTAFTYESKIFVVARIKANEYSLSTDSYIFCGIPNRNWENFKSWNISGDDNYSEKFHEYIMPYKCNCY
jgi:hypothetical protein